MWERVNPTWENRVSLHSIDSSVVAGCHFHVEMTRSHMEMTSSHVGMTRSHIEICPRRLSTSGSRFATAGSDIGATEIHMAAPQTQWVCGETHWFRANATVGRTVEERPVFHPYLTIAGPPASPS